MNPRILQVLMLAGLPVLATLATVLPVCHHGCLLDRDALLTGEVWRLWTGHLAHFSLNHLLVDLLVFALLSWALFRSGERGFGWLLFVGGAVLSLSLVACDPALACYGGLSGLNALLLGRLAVRWVQSSGQPRTLGLALLAATLGKFTFDTLGYSGPGVDFDSTAVVPSHLSHWLGLFWGLALPVSARAKNQVAAGILPAVEGGVPPAG